MITSQHRPMRPIKVLPENYSKSGVINLATNRVVLKLINLISLGMLFLYGWLFVQAIYWLRPGDAVHGLRVDIDGLFSIIGAIFYVLLIYVFMIVLHEAVHGLFFWFFTRSKPVYALRLYYAYAAAPDWYLPRRQYLVIALAPFLLLTVLGLLLITVVPAGWFFTLLVLVAVNASGAVGDVAIAIWVFLQPRDCLARDQGDEVTLYLPIKVEKDQ